MSDIEATKFYVRFREGHPETEMQDYARRGMWSLNVETAPFLWVDDIANIDDLGPTVGIAGYIGDVWAGLKRLGKPIPEPVDYPEVLTEFLGRKVWQSTLAEVRTHVNPIFVKPVSQKDFTGFLWSPDIASRRKIITHHDDTPVWCSDPVVFEAEYRSFILRGEILDCRLYKGDWSKSPNRDVVESAVRASAGTDVAYCLDWGITDTGKTLLVEKNSGYAFGHYGLHPIKYARMLSACWNQLAR